MVNSQASPHSSAGLQEWHAIRLPQSSIPPHPSGLLIGTIVLLLVVLRLDSCPAGVQNAQ